jgi:hypothetical protein
MAGAVIRKNSQIDVAGNFLLGQNVVPLSPLIDPLDVPRVRNKGDREVTAIVV